MKFGVCVDRESRLLFLAEFGLDQERVMGTNPSQFENLVKIETFWQIFVPRVTLYTDPAEIKPVSIDHWQNRQHAQTPSGLVVLTVSSLSVCPSRC